MSDLAGMTGRIGVVGSGRGFYVLSLFVLNIGLAVRWARRNSVVPAGFHVRGAVHGAHARHPETLYFFLPRLTEEERPGFLGRTLLFLAASGVALFLFFLFSAPFFAGLQGNSGIIRSLRLFGVYGGFMVAAAFADPIFIIFKRVRYLFAVSMLHGLFFMGITAWRYWWTPGADALFVSMAVFSGLKCALALFLVIRMKPLTGGIDLFGGRRMLLLQLSFSIPVALSTTVDIISTWLDKFVVSFYLGKDALGVILYRRDGDSVHFRAPHLGLRRGVAGCSVPTITAGTWRDSRIL